MHLDLDLPVAPADLAALALDVEREAPGLVAARLRLGRLREEVADLVEEADVRRRVRARRAPDGGLVDGDDLVELVEPGDAAVRSRPLLRLVQAVRDGLVEHLVDQRRLPRARDARHAAEAAERDFRVDVLEIVLRRPLDAAVSRRSAPSRRPLDPPRSGQEL